MSKYESDWDDDDDLKEINEEKDEKLDNDLKCDIDNEIDEDYNPFERPKYKYERGVLLLSDKIMKLLRNL